MQIEELDSLFTDIADAIREQDGSEEPISAQDFPERVRGLSGSGNIPAGEVYSTEEVRIGTWIDGKPLYRKVGSGTIQAGSQVVPSGMTAADLQVETLVTCKILTISGTVHFAATYAQRASNDNDSYLFLSSILCAYSEKKGLYVSCVAINDTYFSSKPFYAVAEYTKTTDEPETT